jgi:DNA-binding IclR family transcriptional regulator
MQQITIPLDDQSVARLQELAQQRGETVEQTAQALLRATLRTGIGEEHEEYMVGVNALATTIRGLSGEVIALIWIAGFSSRFSGSILQQTREALRDEAQAISRALGAH